MIVKRERISFVVTGVAVLALGLAASAWAHGFRGGPFERGGEPGPRGPRGGGVLQLLIFPCRAGCFDAARTCGEPAESAAVTCAEESCGSEIQAARTACQADPRSEDCRNARAALLECAQPCLDAAHSTLESCRDTLEECLSTCGSS
jgi:hypothetical protein